jgi:signal transduction histidine kinase
MRERVALMGGEIEIAGKRGKGTRVTIRVPLQPG